MSLRFLICLTLVAVAPLRADGLADLKAQLGRLKGSEPLKASVDRQIWNQHGDEKKPSLTQGQASVWVEESSQGLKLFWSRDQIQAVAQERKARELDPEKSTPTRDVMSGLDTPTLEEYFNSAEKILRLLDQAKLLTERPDTLDGKPVRLLTFTVEPRLSQQSRKYVKELEATAKLWIDAEGTPVAEEDLVRIKARAFMVVNFKHEEKNESRYMRVGNRLVTQRHHHEESSSGGGENGQGKQTTTLKYN